MDFYIIETKILTFDKVWGGEHLHLPPSEIKIKHPSSTMVENFEERKAEKGK